MDPAFYQHIMGKGVCDRCHKVVDPKEICKVTSEKAGTLSLCSECMTALNEEIGQKDRHLCMDCGKKMLESDTYELLEGTLCSRCYSKRLKRAQKPPEVIKEPQKVPLKVIGARGDFLMAYFGLKGTQEERKERPKSIWEKVLDRRKEEKGT